MSRETEWTREREDILMELWMNSTLSATEIGGKMGLTKGQVIGKAYRMKLKKKARAPSKIHSKKKKLMLEKPIKRPENCAPVSLMELTNGCRFPIGDPRDEGFVFCNGAVKEDQAGRKSVYCGHHAKIAYLPKSRKRKAPPLGYTPGKAA